jgi:undecaprenyl-diphosphatase
MLSYFQAIILGALQGVSELFPISSLGHSVILPGLFGWNIDQSANYFLTFLVATHFATAAVLFVLYREDWRRIIVGMGRSLRDREIKASDRDAKLGWLLVVGTIPAGIVGVLFQEQIQKFFLSPAPAAFFLMLNGVLLYGAEVLRRRVVQKSSREDADTRIAAEISWWQAVKVGTMQVLALLPGFSRTGSTIAGGLGAGLSHEDALRFSFLLATPIIGAAALLKLPELFTAGNQAALGVAAVGALCSAVGAYFSAKFLAKYFKTKTLTPFAIYCFLFGAASLILLSR